jgi:hypothetical protein
VISSPCDEGSWIRPESGSGAGRWFTVSPEADEPISW